jgi:hypothetical protein
MEQKSMHNKNDATGSGEIMLYNTTILHHNGYGAAHNPNDATGSGEIVLFDTAMLPHNGYGAAHNPMMQQEVVKSCCITPPCFTIMLMEQHTTQIMLQEVVKSCCITPPFCTIMVMEQHAPPKGCNRKW